MSDTRRDQRRRPRSGQNCPESAGGGCAYCRTGDYKRRDRRSRRQRGKAEARRADRED